MNELDHSTAEWFRRDLRNHVNKDFRQERLPDMQDVTLSTLRSQQEFQYSTMSGQCDSHPRNQEGRTLVRRFWIVTSI